MPPRTRAGLTRQRVLRTALDLVDREGVDALSMRRLGRELGVEAMSLYGYVESKQDLVEGVVEQVFREMPLITPGPGSWQDRLRIHAATYRAVLLRHPNAVRLVAGRPLITEGTIAFVESALQELCGIGLDLATADLVLDLVASYTLGHVAEQVGNETRGPDYVAHGRETVDTTPFPHVAALWQVPSTDPEREFAFGFELIIAGIERLLESRADHG
jgi:AcrR family transcriptional regulator